jgi:hypothetical protein
MADMGQHRLPFWKKKRESFMSNIRKKDHVSKTKPFHIEICRATGGLHSGQ